MYVTNTFTDLDECATNDYQCVDSVCHNLPGRKYECVCSPGQFFNDSTDQCEGTFFYNLCMS